MAVLLSRSVVLSAVFGLFAVFGFLVATARPVSAQLAANEVYANQPFQLAWTHDGINTNVYRYFRGTTAANAVQVGADIPVSARVNGEVFVDHPSGLPAGSYVVRLVAVGDGGSTPSADFALVSRALPPAPGVPTLPRIIRVTP